MRSFEGRQRDFGLISFVHDCAAAAIARAVSGCYPNEGVNLGRPKCEVPDFIRHGLSREPQVLRS